jgi:hypothetical protein
MADPAGIPKATAAAGDALRGVVESGIVRIEGVPGDIAEVPFLQHLATVLPTADLILGGGMLLVIVLIHAAGVRAVTGFVLRRTQRYLASPSIWRADVLVGTAVGLLLTLHLVEIFIWAGALVYTNLVPDWRVAGFFAGNTYTTVGYGNFVLSQKWQMLAPIIAISGLFTFGWTGSVLVDIVRRGNEIKDAAVAAKLAARQPRAPAAGSPASAKPPADS